MIYCRRRGNWSSWNETSAGEVVRKEKWVSMYVCVGGCVWRVEYFLAKIPIYGKYYRRSSEATLSIVVGLVLLLKMVSVCTVLLFCMLNRWFLYSVRLLQILVFMLMQYNPTKLSLQPCAHYVHACLFARIHGAQCGSGYLGRGVEFVYRTVAGRIRVTLDACCVLRAA